MNYTPKSIRTFIGAKNFNTSINFYQDFGFGEIFISDKMSLFKLDNIGFYLQDAYVKN